MNFQHSYRELDPATSEMSQPQALVQPRLLLWNNTLAEQLGLPEELRKSSQLQNRFASGQQSLAGSSAYALAYAGHQFGRFSGRLGDGRAHLLGEWQNPQGQIFDIQLKGSGQTPFSRGGDGLCALGPALREYVMSEAAHALGIRSARSLSVVATGNTIMREQPTPGAIVGRVAQSHLRVGTFQWFAATEQTDLLKKLCIYTLQRHFPERFDPVMGSITTPIDTTQSALVLLDAVIEKQISLICDWMRVGFIHGVMNTDNCSIAGETIDFGPCAMLGTYHPSAVFSSIDRQGRYAFGNQPAIMNWNLARLAESLLDVIDSNSEHALSLVRPIIESIPARFDTAYYHMLGQKFGLLITANNKQQTSVNHEQRALIDAMLEAMQNEELDYTLTFRQLKRYLKNQLNDHEKDNIQHHLGDLFTQWLTQVNATETDKHDAIAQMSRSNPEIVPRNYFIEKALSEAVTNGSLTPLTEYLKIWQAPYIEREDNFELLHSKADFDQSYQTFCGT